MAKTDKGNQLFFFTNKYTNYLVTTLFPGCWKVKFVEFLEPSEDSALTVDMATKMVTCFDKNGKFITKMVEGKDQIIVGTGTYKISLNGKTITQKRDADDGGVDAPGEIVKMNSKEFSIKVENVILHFEKKRDE